MSSVREVAVGVPAFLYFDLGNVLLHFDHERACRQMSGVSGIPVERIREVVFEGGMQWQYERGELTTEEFYGLFCAATGTRQTRDELLMAASDIFWLNTSIVPLLTQLRQAGHRLGILSNTCDAHWQHVGAGRYAALTEFFEVHALSFELRSMKPDRAIYDQAAAMAGVRPQEIFFVDDREENVRGAREAGFDAVQYTTSAELVRELQQRGVRLNDEPPIRSCPR